MARRIHPVALLFFLAFAALSGCDLEGQKDCAWVLEPDPDKIAKVDPGFVPVCARNRTSGKQDCRLQVELTYAKNSATRKFRYVDLKVKSYGIPRTISEIKFCD